MITREAVSLWSNTNAFMQNINRQYDDSFANGGAKIGSQLRIRYPNDYTVSDGPAISVQDTAEQNTLLSLAIQRTVAISFDSADLTLSIDDYSERILAPQINALAGNVAQEIMKGVETGVCNLITNVDGNGNIISPTVFTYLEADAILENNSAPAGNRKIVNKPVTNARVVASASGLLNPAATISQQYRNGRMMNAVGFDWMTDQTVISHTTGTFTLGTVSGAGQTGNTLAVNAITGTLTAGDIITLTNVNSVNMITKTSDGAPRQFVVTAPAISGATSISIFPAIVPAVNGSQQQYQTVDVSPADAAPILLATPAGGTYRKNIAFCPEAITMVTADLIMPDNVTVARDNFDGVSMRMIQQYNSLTDQNVQRLDVLFGYQYLRPQWSVIVADVV